VATQNKWLQRGINVPLKSERLAQYFKTFRKELVEITHAAGYEHPAQFKMSDIQINVDDQNISKGLQNVHGYVKDPVLFNEMQALYDCTHLGGRKQRS
jgi:YbbR domain-containing protein